MPIDRSDELANVRTISQLVRFLRDEMDWPIDQGDFVDVEDFFYDFTAEELGIDSRTAAKIDSIKRLRPLSTNQPWGIFFVKFEPKRLPVVALRRILGQVALKKRPSANSADRTAWEKDDLLFISNYGQGEERQISFAHFSSPPDARDLPTLKVLGWDSRDTKLHLDAVAHELTGHLRWPEDDENVAAWRDQWRSAFTLGHREVITTSKELSIRLAELARTIYDRIKSAVAIETDKGPLTSLMSAFRESLVHDLEADGFAHMYAQTIAYGLLSARIADPHKKTADDFAAHMRTNPFLRELMETFLRIGGRRGKAGGPGIDFDELGVSEVVELLDDANMEAVVRDFGDRNPQEDPVIHFYERFLSYYNPGEKKKRGVFYTPRPVVSYIVRAVDELLRTEFDLGDGLADIATWSEMAERHADLVIPDGVSPKQDFVQILDPATGTGTFLVEVIDLIHKTLFAKWKSQGHGEARIDALWNEYVPKHLLTRLHGYELLMAPYAIAHLKIGLKLYETGYHFGSDERARIYLTNALEPAQDFAGTFEFAIPALAHEAQAVNEIKRNQRFTVTIGNPPYSKLSGNLAPEHRRLVDAYRYVANKRIHERGALALEMNLQDDYVKFVRMAQLAVGCGGVAGIITNHGYITTPTLRGMRFSLLDSFDLIRVLDLHGHSGKGERSPDGTSDENVFDIQQGVAVSLFVKRPLGSSLSRVFHSDLYGSRAEKYDRLERARTLGDLDWEPVTPGPPNYQFASTEFTGSEEYSTWPSLNQMLGLSSDGIVTARDGLVIAFTRHELVERLFEFRQATGTARQVCERFRIGPDSAGFDPDEALRVLRAETDLEKHIIKIQYRPFDYRYLFYFRGFVQSMRWPVTSQLTIPSNVLLAVTRQVNRPQYEHAFVSKFMFEKKTVSHDRNTQVFPLMITAEAGELDFGSQLHGNWTQSFSQSWRSLTGNDPRESVNALSPLPFVYSILHSPTYRLRYFPSLRAEFPRIPICGNRQLARELTILGRELVSLHLLESPRLEQAVTEFVGSRDLAVETISWSANAVWLDKTRTTGFRGVAETVWQFRIGGYQVCDKWLKDRKGRPLTDDEIVHYQKIVVALSETIRLMKEIDEVIETYGGWPGAFETSAPAVEFSEVLPAAEMQSAASTPLQFRPRTVEPSEPDRYVTCVPIFELAAAAGAFGDPQHVDEDSFEWVAVDTRRKLRRGMFVAQVVGCSMEPTIPDGAYCLFASPVEGTREGKTVLVQLRDARDPETGQRYTVKRYESVKRAQADGWQHESITLKPINPDFEPIHLTGETDDEYRVIAEFLEVLGEPAEEDAAGGHAPSFPVARFESRPGAAAVEPVEEIELEDDAADVRRVDIDDLDRDEVICLIRQVFGDGVTRPRDAAIRELARALGYARTGSRVSKVLDNALVTAVRRGVIANIGGDLKLEARRIDEYDRDFLKAQFIASLDGRAWKDRADSIRDFARWMGFRRTGPVIEETARSLIKGLLRAGRLEADGQSIRRSG